MGREKPCGGGGGVTGGTTWASTIRPRFSLRGWLAGLSAVRKNGCARYYVPAGHRTGGFQSVGTWRGLGSVRNKRA